MTVMKEFITHKGIAVSGKELELALNAVAQDMEDLALRIKREDGYAQHITEEEKYIILTDSLIFVEKIRKGEIEFNFTIWQRINRKLTGDYVPLFSKS